jgi:hypothetical protein
MRKFVPAMAVALCAMAGARASTQTCNPDLSHLSAKTGIT